MIMAALIFLILFCVLAGIDGTYFHFNKHKLDERPASKKEHGIHTIRSIFFPPMVLIFFTLNSGGWLLWLGVLLVVLDFAALILDLQEEEKSRADLGGLSHGEYIIHVLANGFHFLWIALILSTRESSDWAFDSSVIVHSTNLFMILTGLIAFGGIVGALDHIKRYLKSPNKSRYQMEKTNNL